LRRLSDTLEDLFQKLQSSSVSIKQSFSPSTNLSDIFKG
jgi:hypothetical protein